MRRGRGGWGWLCHQRADPGCRGRLVLDECCSGFSQWPLQDVGSDCKSMLIFFFFFALFFFEKKKKFFSFIFNFTILFWFCHISTCIHHRYTHVPHPEPSSLLPPPSLYHPSGSSQCTSPKHQVSCIEPGLVTRFIYDIICFNAIRPNQPTLSLSHRVQKTVLYISVSFAVSYTGLLLPSF